MALDVRPIANRWTVCPIGSALHRSDSLSFYSWYDSILYSMVNYTIAWAPGGGRKTSRRAWLYPPLTLRPIFDFTSNTSSFGLRPQSDQEQP